MADQDKMDGGPGSGLGVTSEVQAPDNEKENFNQVRSSLAPLATNAKMMNTTDDSQTFPQHLAKTDKKLLSIDLEIANEKSKGQDYELAEIKVVEPEIIYEPFLEDDLKPDEIPSQRADQMAPLPETVKPESEVPRILENGPKKSRQKNSIDELVRETKRYHNYDKSLIWQRYINFFFATVSMAFFFSNIVWIIRQYDGFKVYNEHDPGRCNWIIIATIQWGIELIIFSYKIAYADYKWGFRSCILQALYVWPSMVYISIGSFQYYDQTLSKITELGLSSVIGDDLLGQVCGMQFLININTIARLVLYGTIIVQHFGVAFVWFFCCIGCPFECNQRDEIINLFEDNMVCVYPGRKSDHVVRYYDPLEDASLECNICLEHFQISPDKRIVQLSCGVNHTFHFDCLVDHVRMNNVIEDNKVHPKCPICQKSFLFQQ